MPKTNGDKRYSVQSQGDHRIRRPGQTLRYGQDYAVALSEQAKYFSLSKSFFQTTRQLPDV